MMWSKSKQEELLGALWVIAGLLAWHFEAPSWVFWTIMGLVAASLIPAFFLSIWNSIGEVKHD